jgi:glycosyltransferase involved in cell wall biosynthesis
MARLTKLLKRSLGQSRPALVMRDLRAGLLQASSNLKAGVWRMASLQPATPPRGNVLLSYILDGFLLKDGQPLPASHTHQWETMQMARTWAELGYAVDVIHYRNQRFEPAKKYSVVIDVRRNLERLAPTLAAECLKIFHADTSHLNVLCAAEFRRLLELQERRGVSLSPRRLSVHNQAIENADCATILGNEVTLSTFRYANKPMYSLPVPAAVQFPCPDGKDLSASRRNFLWFGSHGMVHKGLDLTLEAFAEMPDCHLYICGPVHKEEDFVEAYSQELFHKPNIHTLGWADVESEAFKNILDQCVGMIYPSCSEGQAGSVVTCMQAGLIPIISRESGVSVEPFGEILGDCSVSTIRETVRMVSELPEAELRKRTRQTWEYARAHHTREAYAEAYRSTMLQILTRFGRL